MKNVNMHPQEYKKLLIRNEPRLYGIEVGDIWLTGGSAQTPILVLDTGISEFSDCTLVQLIDGEIYTPAFNEREHFLKLVFMRGLVDELYRLY